jgi:hypothetical protein
MRSKEIILLLLLSVFVTSSQAFNKIELKPDSSSNSANTDSTDIQREMVRNLVHRFGFGPNWRYCGYFIGVDHLGKIRGLRGIPFYPDSTSRLTEWAYNFLETNRNDLGIENPQQELLLSRKFPRVVRMQQVVNGVKVLNGFVQFELDSDTSSIAIDLYSYFPEARNINSTPSIDSLQAFSIALDDPVNDTIPSVAHNAKLIIAKFNDGFHLVWDFFITGGGYFNGGSEFFIDAHDGSILRITTDSVD